MVRTRWTCSQCGSWISAGPRPGSTVRMCGGHSGRHLLAAADRALWDPHYAALVALPEVDQRFETQPADMQAFLYREVAGQ